MDNFQEDFIQNHLFDLVENANDLIQSVDDKGRFIYVNKSWRRVLGYSRDDLNYLDFFDIVCRDKHPQCQSKWELLRQTPSIHFVDTIFYAKDGRQIYLEGSVASHFKEGRFAGTYCILRDVSERKRMENDLRKQYAEVLQLTERLEHLTRRILEVQEEERLRIARDLHDGLGQYLTLMHQQMQRFHLPGGVDDIRSALEGLERHSKSAWDEFRRALSDLRPPFLDELGLEAALDWKMRQFRNIFQGVVTSRIDLTGMPVISRSAQICVFRIFQEMLTNIQRHSQASRVWISITASSGQLDIEVGDDGVGFDASRIYKTNLGLMAMEERVKMMGGVFFCKSAPGRGTSIKTVLPGASQDSNVKSDKI
ncbi:MAG: PAS domain-containing sensor histidine kinase [Desulfobacteraceae bacterium]|nr:PAS domain-containing sensor histidine kinase [Desulfobacteraceae bacterium]